MNSDVTLSNCKSSPKYMDQCWYVQSNATAQSNAVLEEWQQYY